MNLDPKIWGKYYWFTLHTIGLTYPNNPNAIIKKQYYTLIQNLPLFIPHERLSLECKEYLDKYPVSAYLDSKESLLKWLHFIHNKINKKFGKPMISYSQYYEEYFDNYKNKDTLESQTKVQKYKILYICSIMLFVIIIFILSK